MQVFLYRYLSIQGRSIKYLHERWRDFKFDPNTDDLEVFISDVKQITNQLNHNNKGSLQFNQGLYASRYLQYFGPLQGLDVAITKVKDIYAKKTELQWQQGPLHFLCIILQTSTSKF